MSVWNRLTSLWRGRRQPTRPRTGQRLLMEPLEDRCLLSGVIGTGAGISLSSGTLTFIGSGYKDIATVSATASGGVARMTSWTASGTTIEYTRSFSAGSVTQIHFYGNDGDDRFENNLTVLGIGGTFSVPVTARGGAGHDTLLGGDAADHLYGDAGHDWLEGRGANDNLYGGSDNDSLLGGSGHDSLFGDSGNDALDGGANNDTLEGGAHNDTLFGGGGNEVYRFAGTLLGKDEILHSSGVNTLDFSDFTDGVIVDLASTSWQTMLNTNSLQLKLGSASSIQHVRGSASRDVIRGNDLDNDLAGAGGNDFLEGRGGNDRLDGDAGNDTLEGGAGDDLLYGDIGDDTYVFGAGALGRDELVNEVALTSGTDTLDFRNFTGSVELDLSVSRWQEVNWAFLSLRLNSASAIRIVHGSASGDIIRGNHLDNEIHGHGGGDLLVGRGGNDTVYGGAGDDRLEGNAGHDWLDGGANNDTLLGHAGDDTLRGGSGDDELDGGAHNDSLFGDTGTNYLTGGTGYDRFLMWAEFNVGGGNRVADAVLDLYRSEDALIHFASDDRSWQLSEVELIDLALKRLVDETGDTSWLKPAESDVPFTFVRVKEGEPTELAVNATEAPPDGYALLYARVIVSNAAFGRPADETVALIVSATRDLFEFTAIAQ